MAERVVALVCCRNLSGASALGVLLLLACGCSSFDPVQAARFTLLNSDTYADLDMQGAHWAVYDDQHSLSAACTNGAAGNHAPDECSIVYAPWSVWQEPKCPPSEDQLKEAALPDPRKGPICIRGILRKLLGCVNSEPQCYDPNNEDSSNMWGAGVSLTFSADGKRPWHADKHRVRGVAFDLTGMDPSELGEHALNVRVGVPIVLDATTKLPFNRPAMRDDGAVIGTDERLYRYDCKADLLTDSPLPADQNTKTLRDVLVGDAAAAEPAFVTSERHPMGSPFWQPNRTPAWVPSPVRVGHNDFEWREVLAPKDSNYDFQSAGGASPEILGITFQVVHEDPNRGQEVEFSFCIENLAVLLED